MKERIYLAGKITKNGWRHEIVDPGLFGDAAEQPNWPVLERAILGEHDFTGPFFLRCDHGCAHGEGTHGVAAGADVEAACYIEKTARTAVVRKCLAAITRSTMVFAWIDSHEAFGSLFELGYATSLHIPIVIATPPDFRVNDEWFAFTAASRVIRESSPSTALAKTFAEAGAIDRLPVGGRYDDGIVALPPNWEPEIRRASVSHQLDEIKRAQREQHRLVHLWDRAANAVWRARDYTNRAADLDRRLSRVAAQGETAFSALTDMYLSAVGAVPRK